MKSTVNDPDLFTQGYFIGYVKGTVESMEAKKLHACINDVPQDQIVNVVRKYTNDHPEKWHLPFTTIVANSLNDAFPCSK